MTAVAERGDRSADTKAAGVIAVLCASLLWSFGGVLGKSADAPGVVLSFWRLMMSTVVLLVASYALRRLPSWADVKASAVSGVLFGVNLCAFFITLQYTTIAVALIIGALSPVIALPIAVRFMGETFTPIKVGCALLAVGGVIVAVLTAPTADTGGATKAVGYLWAVASLLIWVLYLLQTKRVRASVETVRYLTSVSTIAMLTVSVIVLVTRADLGQVHGAGWLWTALLAVGPGIGGHGLVAWAQPRIDASVTSVLIQLEPVGASIAAWVFLHERVSFAQMSAMVAVVVALSALAFSESRQRVVVVDEALG